jgi:SAM-dependent methyltransferase
VAHRDKRRSRLDASLADYPRRYCSVCDRVVDREFAPGPGGRPDASCPRCGSLERHRFLAVALGVLRPTLGDIGLLLDIAPSAQTTKMLRGLGARQYVRLDLGADPRRVDVFGSVTELPFAAGSVDVLVCYHVLEHVPDDLAGMREIARVLSEDGVAIVQVPWRPGTVTDEDPDAPEDERVRRFGQADHVRYYGDDFEDRLVSCGLAMQRITPRTLLGPHMVTWLHLVADETVWILRRSDAPVVPDAVGDVEPGGLQLTLEAMLDEMTTLRGRLVEQRDLVRELRGSDTPSLRVRVRSAVRPARREG